MPRMPIRRILLATDFSAAAGHAFDHAVDLARDWRAELVLLHAIESIALPEDFTAASTVAERLERAARQAVAELEARAKRKGVRCHGVVRSGSAASTIIDVAKRLRSGLIVLGTHGRRGLSRFFMGSVAERVVRTSACPVLTVREQRTLAPPARRKPRRKHLAAR
jgi:nucleotide-binding universal stress UspA family protein